jgi:hypothetical protein
MGSGRRFETIAKGESPRFVLSDPVEKNWDLYQDAVEKYPEKVHQLKLRYDQYLKTLTHYSKEQLGTEEDPTIEFPVAK